MNGLIRQDRRRRRDFGSAGFSLMELMVVVAIVAVISLIAVPSYNWAMRKTRRAEGKVLLQTIMAAEERYYSNLNRYTDQVGDEGIAAPTESLPGRYYVLSQMTLGDDAQTVSISVAPQGAQQGDPCGDLTLDSSGRRGSAGGAQDASGCW